MLGEGAPHGTGLLGPEVKRFEFLGFVELSQVLTLRMADDSQNTSNGFSYKFSATKVILSVTTYSSKVNKQ